MGDRDRVLEERFVAAFPRLYPRARRVAHRIVGDEATAEDVAAEAMARAYANWERIEALPWVDGWVLRVTANLAIDVARRRPVALEPPPPVQSEDAIATRLAMVAALGHLPRRQREAISLYYLAGMSEADVANVLGISSGTLKSHLHRGLVALRARLGEGLEEVRLAVD